MENKDVFIKTFPLVWIYTIVVGIILFLTAGNNWAISFVLGSVTSLMMMSMLYKSSKRVMQSEKDVAQKLAVRGYLIRYLFYAMVLVLSGLLPNLEILGTAAGLFSFKIVLYINIFLENRGEKK